MSGSAKHPEIDNLTYPGYTANCTRDWTLKERSEDGLVEIWRHWDTVHWTAYHVVAVNGIAIVRFQEDSPSIPKTHDAYAIVRATVAALKSL